MSTNPKEVNPLEKSKRSTDRTLRDHGLRRLP